jgi:hypothetical protein
MADQLVAARPRAEHEPPDPATLHGVIRAAIARDLKAHYEVPQSVPHEILVLLMQLNEDSKKKRARASA